MNISSPNPEKFHQSRIAREEEDLRLGVGRKGALRNLWRSRSVLATTSQSSDFGVEKSRESQTASLQAEMPLGPWAGVL